MTRPRPSRPGPRTAGNGAAVPRVKQQQQFRAYGPSASLVGSDAPMRVLCQRVERFLPELFRTPGVGGQQAERSLPNGGPGRSAAAQPAVPWRDRNPYQALNSMRKPNPHGLEGDLYP